MSEAEELGNIVRARREAMRLSQEGLAALAFENSERKGYISNIENARRNVTSETVRRIAVVLGIERHEVPARFRWHDGHEALQGKGEAPAPADPVASSIAWARAMVERSVARPPPQEYRRALVRGLRCLQDWTGAPFGLRSLGVSMTIAYVYTILFGGLAYMQGGGAVGVVDVFSPPGWAREVSAGTLAASIAVLLAGTGAAIMHLLAIRPAASASAAPKRLRRTDARRPRGITVVASSDGECSERLRGERHSFLVRAMFLGAFLGGAAMAAGALGVDKTAAACFMAIVAFAAMTTRAGWMPLSLGRLAERSPA